MLNCSNHISVKVYPSLESDEEDHANKAKMKRKKNWDDTPWSPKGKRLTHRSMLCFSFLICDFIIIYFHLQPG